MKTVDFVAIAVERTAGQIENALGLVSDARSEELRLALTKVVSRYIEFCTNEMLASARCHGNAVVEAERRAEVKAGAH